MKTMHSQEVGSFSQQAFLPKFGGTINHFINRGEIMMLFIYNYKLKGINNCGGPLNNTYNSTSYYVEHLPPHIAL